MRKILSILASISLTSVATLSVIACGEVRVNSITINVGSQDFADGVNVQGDAKKYSKSELETAVTTNIPYGASNFSQLFKPLNINKKNSTINNDLFSVITSSNRKIVKPNNDQAQLRDWRDLYAGREAYNWDAQKNKAENERYLRPSVDGMLFNWEDEIKYYDSFQTSSINSLEGLYRLANFTGNLTSTQLKASQTMAKTVFDSADGKEFADLYLKASPYNEGAFTNIRYNASKTVSEIFSHYETQASMFNWVEKISPNANFTLKDSGQYSKVNKVEQETIDKEIKDNRITGRTNSDPLGMLILSGGTTPTAATTLSVLDKEANDHQPMIQLKDSSTVYFYDQSKDEKTTNYALVNNQYYYQPVGDLSLEYDFNSDVRNNKGPKFRLNFNLSNLNAIWAPILGKSTEKDYKDTDEVKDRQVLWTFIGYKFSNGTDTIGYQTGTITDEVKTKLTFERDHRFQDLTINGLTIQKITE